MPVNQTDSLCDRGQLYIYMLLYEITSWAYVTRLLELQTQSDATPDGRFVHICEHFTDGYHSRDVFLYNNIFPEDC